MKNVLIITGVFPPMSEIEVFGCMDWQNISHGLAGIR